MKPTILIDCDGVLADFGGAFLAAVLKETGESFDLSDITQWDITRCMFFRELEVKYPGLEKKLWADYIAKPGFCDKIAVLPGAQGAMERLQSLGDVFVVTSPMATAPTWMYERENWLQRLFDIPRDHVIHAGKKYLVHGDVLIDDKPSHVRAWHTKWSRTGGYGILWNAPYNATDDAGHRVNGWRELFPFLRSKLYLSD